MIRHRRRVEHIPRTTTREEPLKTLVRSTKQSIETGCSHRTANRDRRRRVNAHRSLLIHGAQQIHGGRVCSHIRHRWKPGERCHLSSIQSGEDISPAGIHSELDVVR